MKTGKHILALLLTVSMAFATQADEINYGDFAGDTVTYVDVTENSLEKLPLYGTPTVVGDELDMPGTGFVSQSENGGIDFLDGRLTFMIEADPGTTISSVTIREFGAYFTFGEESIASVAGLAFVETLEGGLFSGTLNFEVGGGPGPNPGLWQEEVTITFPETTKVTVTLDNQLFTFADNPGIAFIDKKGVDIIPNIPEPGLATVLLAGVAGIALRRRR